MISRHWLRGARAALDQAFSQRSHLVVDTADGRDGFAVFGGFRARHRFRALYLPDAERTRTRLAVHRPATADSCRRLVERYGMVVFCGRSVPHGLETDLLSMPLSVDMEAVVPRTTEAGDARWTRSALANIAKIRKTGFVYDVVAGGTWISAFSRRMFRPSLHRRHGARAYLDSPGALARYARADGAELLRVLLDGQWVAGLLAQSLPEGYRFLKLGWLDGDDELLKRGVVSAMYWFGFQRAAALGHQRLLLGSVEPHLEDGLLRYKGNWGGLLSTDSRDFGHFLLLLEPSHPSCSRFLRTHSTILRGTDRSFVVVSGQRPDDVIIRPQLLDGISRWYQWRDRPVSPSEVSADLPPRLRPWVRQLTGLAHAP